MREVDRLVWKGDILGDGNGFGGWTQGKCLGEEAWKLLVVKDLEDVAIYVINLGYVSQMGSSILR